MKDCVNNKFCMDLRQKSGDVNPPSISPFKYFTPVHRDTEEAVQRVN